MRVVFLGTGGYHPNHRRQTAGILLPELGVAFDAGTCWFRLASYLLRPDLHVFLSHAHLDHVVGLTYTIVPMHEGVLRSVQVSSTPEYLAAVQDHLFASALFPARPAYTFTPLPDATPLPDGSTLRFCGLKHPGGSLGFRIDWPDRSLAYITDTTADGSYDEFVRGVEMLIHECYFPDERAAWCASTGHSHTSAVAELARRTHVGRLFLVHIDPQRMGDDPIGLGQARQVFADTHLAEDLLEIEL